MVSESVIDLEGEVLEFLVTWSSTFPDVHTPGRVLCPPDPADLVQARLDPPCPLHRGFAFVETPCTSGGRRGSKSAVGRTYRYKGALHPHY